MVRLPGPQAECAKLCFVPCYLYFDMPPLQLGLAKLQLCWLVTAIDYGAPHLATTNLEQRYQHRQFGH